MTPSSGGIAAPLFQGFQTVSVIQDPRKIVILHEKLIQEQLNVRLCSSGPAEPLPPPPLARLGESRSFKNLQGIGTFH